MTPDDQLAEAIRLHRKGISKGLIAERIGVEDAQAVWKMLAEVGIEPPPIPASTSKFNWNSGDPKRADRLLRKF